jgi:hypothetical protein
VTPDPEADLILNRVGHFQTRDWPIDIPKEALAHPILQQQDAGATGASGGATIWNDLPGVYWHYPVLREKPVATVLMRHSAPQMRNAYGGHVLLATQFVGAGRSEFVAFDGTWRWRRFGEEVFDRFWVQSLRYVVEGKLLGAKKRVTIHTEGDTFQLGSVINVTARLFDHRFEPLDVDQVQAAFEVDGRKQDFVLKRLADRPGWFEGRFTPNRTGAYAVTLTLPASGGSDAVTATHPLQVVRPNIEIVNPRMDRVALQSLADRSPEGGYYEIDEMGALADAIPDRHEVTTVKSRPEPLWDRWWALAALVGFLSIEWAVRKWVRLL